MQGRGVYPTVDGSEPSIVFLLALNEAISQGGSPVFMPVLSKMDVIPDMCGKREAFACRQDDSPKPDKKQYFQENPKKRWNIPL